MKIPKTSLFIITLLFTITALEAQNSSFTRHFNNGSSLYRSGRFYEAAIEFRRAQEISVNENNWAQAIYWVILSELAYSDYGSALLDMDELERKTPDSVFNRDMTYHRARIYYNQGFFENALVLFRRYIDSVTETDEESLHRKASAFYWMGECLFAMGQFDEAESFYAWILGNYPDSPKREISSYRIDLIKQKKIEQELLALLHWSHEEALRTSEDYQRRIRTYEFTLSSYQRRIAQLLQQDGANQNQLPLQEITSSAESAENITQEYHEDLIDRAKQLGENLEEIIKSIEGTW